MGTGDGQQQSAWPLGWKTPAARFSDGGGLHRVRIGEEGLDEAVCERIPEKAAGSVYNRFAQSNLQRMK